MKSMNVLKKGLCALALAAVCSVGLFAQEKENAPKMPAPKDMQEFKGELGTTKVKGKEFITLKTEKDIFILTVEKNMLPPKEKAQNTPAPAPESNDQKVNKAPENAPEQTVQNNEKPIPAPKKADMPVQHISSKELKILKGRDVKLIGSLDKDSNVIIVKGIITANSEEKAK